MVLLISIKITSFFLRMLFKMIKMSTANMSSFHRIEIPFKIHTNWCIHAHNAHSEEVRSINYWHSSQRILPSWTKPMKPTMMMMVMKEEKKMKNILWQAKLLCKHRFAFAHCAPSNIKFIVEKNYDFTSGICSSLFFFWNWFIVLILPRNQYLSTSHAQSKQFQYLTTSVHNEKPRKNGR